MQKYLMYMHAGSGNHGCEAIVRGLCGQTENNGEAADITVLSHHADEDKLYGLDRICRIIQTRHAEDNFLRHAYFYVLKKVFGRGEPRMKYAYQDAGCFTDYDWAVSIGGDNYCYDDTIYDLRMANSMFGKEGVKTALVGCSIEPELLKRQDVLKDMQRYSVIVARESITYGALCDALGTGKIYLAPDPAFGLIPEKRELPFNFIPGKTIGINVSPLILGYENKDSAGITLSNYIRLTETILNETDLNIALIPHVVWKGNDDRTTLTQLLRTAKARASEPGGIKLPENWLCRISIVPDMPAGQLKYIISECSMFIGARTHATIAAYSTCVPTLVVGYSVKSRGIARDLFGTEDGYVLPVQGLKKETDLAEAFRRFAEGAELQREHLREIMPEYIKRSYQTMEFLK